MLLATVVACYASCRLPALLPDCHYFVQGLALLLEFVPCIFFSQLEKSWKDVDGRQPCPRELSERPV